MAVYYPTPVVCECGHTFTANLARSLNAGRTPAIRDTILRGRLHRVRCTRCGRDRAVERPFFYTDLSRHAVYYVRPRNDRFTYRRDSRRLTVAAEAVPSDLA